ncbi:hypothetical protein F5Y00DRAFT_233510, partial [Daldinia vernicosa]|uniref:uncharacterized protein n=1 Tax=Daldinia vernicosa TaxID=114800 RepID=UPI00200784AD
MGTLHHVLHTSARAISVPEFMDAVRATCTPRFPYARGTSHRRVAVAVSGGVDSMALAFLCSQVRKIDPDFKISDNPVSGFRGIVVDHGLRQGSREEGFAVAKVLKDMGLVDELVAINWLKVLGDSKHPKDLPNFESVARTQRYRKIAAVCAFRNIASLLLAHHEDDQYETVLMRLLQGHGIRGLRGMRPAHDIPECHGLFGANKSGFVDDQARIFPFYNMNPTRRERKHMRREFRNVISNLMAEGETDDWTSTNVDDVKEFYQTKDIPEFAPEDLAVEDGGVVVYRPLLGFSKDRLIATCLENKVPWWEDATNTDPTLTMRNAVRHLYKGYTLPKALQKPAILDLAKRCERRVQAQEAEANRLLRQTIIHDLELLSGTATVQFPKVEVRRARSNSHSYLRHRAQLLRKRQITAILMRKILLLVSPESQPPLLSTLENHVTRLFPSLALPEELPIATPPKAFSIAGVYLMPVESSPSGMTSAGASNQQLSWYLSRMPYPSTQPLPSFRTPYWAPNRNRKGRWLMCHWLDWTLWDGRYWFHIKHRFPYRVLILPFLKEHAKAFREQLPPEDQKRLATLLKRYAPGKVRYTIPAFYLEEPLDLLDMENTNPRPGYPIPLWKVVSTDSNSGDNSSEGESENNEKQVPRSMHPAILDTSKIQLLALPTLGIQLPALDNWMSYETRYRKIDRETLRTAGTFHRGSFAAPRASSLRPSSKKGSKVNTRRYLKKRRNRG